MYNILHFLYIITANSLLLYQNQPQTKMHRVLNINLKCARLLAKIKLKSLPGS